MEVMEAFAGVTLWTFVFPCAPPVLLIHHLGLCVPHSSYNTGESDLEGKIYFMVFSEIHSKCSQTFFPKHLSWRTCSSHFWPFGAIKTHRNKEQNTREICWCLRFLYFKRSVTSSFTKETLSLKLRGKNKNRHGRIMKKQSKIFKYVPLIWSIHFLVFTSEFCKVTVHSFSQNVNL